MDTKPQKHGILQMLAENEKAVAGLYHAYAEKFPHYSDFWSGLADEEMAHFRLIQNVESRDDLSIKIREDRFDPKIIQISLDFIAEKLNQAKTENISVKDAMSVALDIETGMLERGYFDVFEGDSEEVNNVLRTLADETQKHTSKVRDKLTKKRWSLF